VSANRRLGGEGRRAVAVGPTARVACARRTCSVRTRRLRRAFGGVESTGNDAEGDSPVARRLLRELAPACRTPEDVGASSGGAWNARTCAGRWPA